MTLRYQELTYILLHGGINIAHDVMRAQVYRWNVLHLEKRDEGYAKCTPDIET